MARKEKLNNSLYDDSDFQIDLNKDEDLYSMSASELRARKIKQDQEKKIITIIKEQFVSGINKIFDDEKLLDSFQGKDKGQFWFILQIDNFSSLIKIREFIKSFGLTYLIEPHE